MSRSKSGWRRVPDMQLAGFRSFSERLGRHVVSGVEDFGYGTLLLAESLFWIVLGRWWQQPVRFQSMVREMMEVGVLAIPVVSILGFANGAMMAMQGFYTMREFGADKHA